MTKPGPKPKDSYLPEVTEHERVAFVKAIEDFKQRTKLRFPTITQFLRLAKSVLKTHELPVVHFMSRGDQYSPCGMFTGTLEAERQTEDPVKVTCRRCIIIMEKVSSGFGL